MKVLALADRSHHENLKEIIATNQIDIVLLLGDLKYIDVCGLEGINIPVLGIYGNHCTSNYLEELNFINCHMHQHMVNNLSFLGFKGCPYYKGGEHEIDQDEAIRLLGQAPKSDILLAHSPAAGINSNEESPHQGFDGLKRYIEMHSPKFFFHGHSYPEEKQKISIYNETIILFVNRLDIFDLDAILEDKHYPSACSY